MSKKGKFALLALQKLISSPPPPTLSCLSWPGCPPATPSPPHPCPWSPGAVPRASPSSWQDQAIGAPAPTHRGPNPGQRPPRDPGPRWRGGWQPVSWWHRTWWDEAGQEDEPPGQAHGSARALLGSRGGRSQAGSPGRVGGGRSPRSASGGEDPGDKKRWLKALEEVARRHVVDPRGTTPAPGAARVASDGEQRGWGALGDGGEGTPSPLNS